MISVNADFGKKFVLIYTIGVPRFWVQRFWGQGSTLQGLRLEERFALGLRPEIIGPYLPQTSDLCPPNNPEPLNPEPLNL